MTAFVAAPLYSRRGAQPPDDSAAALLATRDVLISALRELELDRLTGAVEEADYSDQRSRLEAQAADVMRAIEERKTDSRS